MPDETRFERPDPPSWAERRRVGRLLWLYSHTDFDLPADVEIAPRAQDVRVNNTLTAFRVISAGSCWLGVTELAGRLVEVAATRVEPADVELLQVRPGR